jgi:hypothetical protein
MRLKDPGKTGPSPEEKYKVPENKGLKKYTPFSIDIFKIYHAIKKWKEKRRSKQ